MLFSENGLSIIARQTAWEKNGGAARGRGANVKGYSYHIYTHAVQKAADDAPGGDRSFYLLHTHSEAMDRPQNT